MKITITYTEKEKIVHKAIKDTITGGLEAIVKYTAVFLMIWGLPLWMFLDWLSKGC